MPFQGGPEGTGGVDRRERQAMGFRLSRWDEKLLAYSELFEGRMMNLEVNYTLEQALDLGWQTLEECFQPDEVGIKQSLVAKYWPKVAETV